MAGSRMPTTDLGRVADFVRGIEESADKRHAATRRAVADTALLYAGLKAWEVYRAHKKRGRR